jgi:hypothetical protein
MVSRVTTLRDLWQTVVLGKPTSQLTSSDFARVTPQVGSPWTTGDLSSIVWADIFGGDTVPVTRTTAIAVPAVAKARHLLCSVIGPLPLLSFTGPTKDVDQPVWMQRTDGDLSPFHRMVWTVDDLLFHGWSLWAVKRGALSDSAPILAAAHVPYDRWDVDSQGFICVDSQRVQAGQGVLIPGPHSGLLNDSAPMVRMAADNLQAAANAARNPNPNIDLHYTGDEPLPDDQRDAMLQSWSDARRGLNGGVGYTNKYVEARTLGSHLDKLLIEGRNADAVDIARAAGVTASSLDATAAGASLEYTTAATRNQELLDYGVKFYMDAISSRLSQDDCLPRGRRTAFDLTEFTTLTPTPTGAPTSD